jgi:hypothetical protein
MTVGQLLHYALQPLRHYQPTVVVCPHGFEITTVEWAEEWRELYAQFGKPVTVSAHYGGGIFGRPRKS